jgi:hypothetical protein
MTFESIASKYTARNVRLDGYGNAYLYIISQVRNQITQKQSIKIDPSEYPSSSYDVYLKASSNVFNMAPLAMAVQQIEITSLKGTVSFDLGKMLNVVEVEVEFNSSFGDFEKKKKEPKEEEKQMNKPTENFKSISEDQDYIRDLWEQENDTKKGLTKEDGTTEERWFATKPPEIQKGVKEYWDYGPGIKVDRKVTEGFSHKEINQLLKNKLEEFEQELRLRKDKIKDYDGLSRYQKWLLVDFSYNLSTKIFLDTYVEFVPALLKRDITLMKEHYERGYYEDKERKNWKPLVKRNKWTLEVIQKMEDEEK